MTIPAIERQVLDAPGDVIARPHANCYWLIPGRLLAGEHPGAVVAAAGVARIDALLDTGVRQFIDLTAEHEGPAPYVATLLERADGARRSASRIGGSRSGISACRPAALMRATLDAIYGALAAGEPVYVHCWGGVGRTGTVVGCLLREQGFDAAEALAVIGRKWQAMEKRVRHPRSPESARAVRVHRASGRATDPVGQGNRTELRRTTTPRPRCSRHGCARRRDARHAVRAAASTPPRRQSRNS